LAYAGLANRSGNLVAKFQLAVWLEQREQCRSRTRYRTLHQRLEQAPTNDLLFLVVTAVFLNLLSHLDHVFWGAHPCQGHARLKPSFLVLLGFFNVRQQSLERAIVAPFTKAIRGTNTQGAQRHSQNGQATAVQGVLGDVEALVAPLHLLLEDVPPLLHGAQI